MHSHACAHTRTRAHTRTHAHTCVGTHTHTHILATSHTSSLRSRINSPRSFFQKHRFSGFRSMVTVCLGVGCIHPCRYGRKKTTSSNHRMLRRINALQQRTTVKKNHRCVLYPRQLLRESFIHLWAILILSSGSKCDVASLCTYVLCMIVTHTQCL